MTLPIFINFSICYYTENERRQYLSGTPAERNGDYYREAYTKRERRGISTSFVQKIQWDSWITANSFFVMETLFGQLIGSHADIRKRGLFFG